MSNDPEEVGRILKKVKEKHDKDKENWKVMGGIDSQGNRDLIISQDPSTFWIKSKAIDPYRSISFGKEMNIKSIDDEINCLIGKTKFNPNEAFHQLFGMAAPSERDIITAAGIERVHPKEMNFLKERVEEKYKNSEINLKKKIRKTWKKQYPDRDNIFL
ncbi:MAG: hypothetical protein GY870_09045 [archaeon]|nr:hypothetical protein [archaeon]